MFYMKPPPPIRLRARCVAVCLLALPAAVSVCGQSAPESSLPANRTAAPSYPAKMIRDIYDPSSAARWLLMRDPACPGGPGKLLLVSAQNLTVGQASTAQPPPPESLIPILRAGDPITLEMHTGNADVWLEAVALNPARLGAPVLARIKIDGRTVHALAAGHGRAILAEPATEAWR